MICHVCWVQDYPRLSFRGGSLYTFHDDIDDEAYKSVYANAAEYDSRFEETPGNLSETLERSECAEGIGSTATNALWTFGVVPVRSHPRTENSNPQSDVQWTPSESFAAIKKLGNEKRDAPSGKDRECNTHARAIVQSFSPGILATRMIARTGSIIWTNYRDGQRKSSILEFDFLWQVLFIRRRNKMLE